LLGGSLKVFSLGLNFLDLGKGSAVKIVLNANDSFLLKGLDFGVDLQDFFLQVISVSLKGVSVHLEGDAFSVNNDGRSSQEVILLQKEGLVLLEGFLIQSLNEDGNLLLDKVSLDLDVFEAWEEVGLFGVFISLNGFVLGELELFSDLEFLISKSVGSRALYVNQTVVVKCESDAVALEEDSLGLVVESEGIGEVLSFSIQVFQSEIELGIDKVKSQFGGFEGFILNKVSEDLGIESLLAWGDKFDKNRDLGEGVEFFGSMIYFSFLSIAESVSKGQSDEAGESFFRNEFLSLVYEVLEDSHKTIGEFLVFKAKFAIYGFGNNLQKGVHHIVVGGGGQSSPDGVSLVIVDTSKLVVVLGLLTVDSRFEGFDKVLSGIEGAGLREVALGDPELGEVIVDILV